MNKKKLYTLFNKNHTYDYEKTESPNERFLLDHVIKFLGTETKIEVQYPINTMSGNFRADIALIHKNKVVIIECDGEEHHTQEIDDLYDEWRDTLILVQRKANSIYRVKGKDIYNSIYSIFSTINKFDSDIFNNDKINRLPKINIIDDSYRKFSDIILTSDTGDTINYTIEIKRKDIKADFDRFWFKYVMYSMLFPDKNIYELIDIFKVKHYDTTDLIKKLNNQYLDLNLEDEKQLLT